MKMFNKTVGDVVTSPIIVEHVLLPADMLQRLMCKLEMEGEQKMKLLEVKTYDNYPEEYMEELDKIIEAGEREFERIMGRKMTAAERRKIYG